MPRLLSSVSGRGESAVVTVDLAGRRPAATSKASTSETDRAAAHRFPAPRFPATISAVPALLLAITLVASAALVLLRSPAIPQVPSSAPQELRVAASRAA